MTPARTARLSATALLLGFGFACSSGSPTARTPSPKPSTSSPSPVSVALTGYFAYKSEWEQAHNKRGVGQYGPDGVDGQAMWQAVYFDEAGRVFTYQFNLSRISTLAQARSAASAQLPPGARLVRAFDQKGCYSEQFSNPIPSTTKELDPAGKPYLIGLNFFSSTTPGAAFNKSHVRFVIFLPSDGSKPDCG